MKGKTFYLVTGILFAFVSILHLTRAILYWPFIINELELNIIYSYIVFVLIGFMSFEAFRHYGNM